MAIKAVLLGNGLPARFARRHANDRANILTGLEAQMMAKEYKKRGGDYNTDKSQQDESQKHLSKWSEEDLQTKEGSGNAKQEDGTEKRYLPKKAWENMNEDEKEETEQKKLKGSKEGKQFVENTGKAKESRKKANDDESEKYEAKKAKEKKSKQGGGDDENDEEDDEEEDEDEDEEEYVEGEEADEDEDGEQDDANEDKHDEEVEGGDAEQGNQNSSAGQKRKQESSGTTSNKKQKSTKEGTTGNAPQGKVGSKHMDAEEPAPRGSADRLPKKGQQITWKAMPGYVDGSVEEILTKQKSVNGKTVKASEKDPRLVLKSSSSGKICVHKPEACFYE